MTTPNTFPARLFPARLHVCIARQARKAIIIRRGPAKEVATIGWDMQSNTFTLGQWFRGRIFALQSDISPDGQHFIYSTWKYQHSSPEAWTAVSEFPWLKALDFYPLPGWDSPPGGGFFTSAGSYRILTDPSKAGYKKSGLRVKQMALPVAADALRGQRIHIRKMARDGWQMPSTAPQGGNTPAFSKMVHPDWRLVRTLRSHELSHSFPPGSAFCHEAFLLQHIPDGKIINLPNWEWAELDGENLLWTEKGRLMSASVGNNGLENILEIHNFNEMKFEEIAAPY